MNPVAERIGRATLAVTIATAPACTTTVNNYSESHTTAPTPARVKTFTPVSTPRVEIAINENGAAQDAARKFFDTVINGNEQQILALLTSGDRDAYNSRKDVREDFWQPRFEAIKSGFKACGATVTNALPVKDVEIFGVPTKATGLVWNKTCPVTFTHGLVHGTFQINAVTIGLQKEGSAWKVTAFEPGRV